MSVFFSMGNSCLGEPNAPQVISCLLSDYAALQCEPTFEGWATYIEYDQDSREAHKYWLVAKKQAKRFVKFLGKEVIDELEDLEPY